MCADDRDECNGDYYEPEGERFFDDGTVAPADEPLGPGLYVSTQVEDVEYDERDGVVVGVTSYIETIRLTPSLLAASRHPVPRSLARVLSMPRRCVRHGGRRRRTRSVSSRGSPGRVDDPHEPWPAVGRVTVACDSRRGVA